jgi:deazaflavin-dependent oxidoreductase (nitroreductase family)
MTNDPTEPYRPTAMWFQALHAAGLVRPIELAVLRHTGVSMVTWATRAHGNLPYIPTLILTTIGRRSGRLHHAPLGFTDDGEAWIVVASYGGSPTHPAWYLNLQPAAPAWVTVNREKDIPVTAETVEGPERNRLWQLITSRPSNYESHQRRADGVRELPIVVLRRRTT